VRILWKIGDVVSDGRTHHGSFIHCWALGLIKEIP
jgi:hypothetical protein